MRPQLVEPAHLAAILAGAPPNQPWLYEAPARALLRAAACLAGTAWRRADILAALTVERARALAGVAEPRGWDDQDLEHVRCPECLKPVTRSPNRVFCSRACKLAAERTTRRERLQTNRPARTCVSCNAPIAPEAAGNRRFCDGCSDYAQRVARSGVVRACPRCGAPIPPEIDGRRQYCDGCSRHVRRGCPKRRAA